MTLLDAAEALLAQASGLCTGPDRAACGGDCCHVPQEQARRVVTVTLADVIALAAFLFRPSDGAGLRLGVARIISESCSASPFTATYMLRAVRGACVFLGEGNRCTVYTVRPLLCRLFFHCDWTGQRLQWDRLLDERVVGQTLAMAAELCRQWEGHAGLLWRQPWRYDEIDLAPPWPEAQRSPTDQCAGPALATSRRAPQSQEKRRTKGGIAFSASSVMTRSPAKES